LKGAFRDPDLSLNFEGVGAISTNGLLTTLDVQIEKLTGMLSENPEDISVLTAYAEFHLRRGRLLEALTAYQKVASIKEDVQDAHLGLARIYMRQNMLPDAYNELLAVFTHAPANVEGRIMYDLISKMMEPPPEVKDAISGFNEQSPELGDLKIFQRQKELEHEILTQEIEQLEKIMEENEGEPIYEYNYEMAIMRKKSVEEFLEYIEILERSLEKQAMEAPPAAPLVEETIEIKPSDEIIQEEEALLEGIASEDEMISPDIIVPGGPSLAEIEGLKDVEEHIDEEGESALLEIDTSGIPDITEFDEEISQEEAAKEVEQEAAKEVEEEIPEALPPGEPAVEDTVSEELPLQPEEPAQEPVKPALSDERKTFYETIREHVTTVLAGLIKTKGVMVVMTVARDGYVVDSIINETIDHEEVGKLVSSGMEVIENWREEAPGSSFLYWVLEFEQGLMVVRSVNARHYLLALGKAGANFGAMRYSMEKGKETLDDILSNAPPNLFGPE
jgi:predicted regulator of Ras-like GTPase activity (Roadblock/LC7/MglB family)/tetratricopeptide (TPR) repeat protein